jgi:hypothetical protein
VSRSEHHQQTIRQHQVCVHVSQPAATPGSVSFKTYTILVWPGWIEGPMEFTQTAAWLRHDYTEQVLDWSRDKARVGRIR